jgi:peptide-methionine (S)-S-oxide reductase
MALAALTLVPPAMLWLAAAGSSDAKAVFAGGCFWGVEAVFEHVRGVRSVTAGYTDGPIEAVQVVFDPAQITHRQLLQVFFTIAHDPTQRDRQGPDAGPEYRAVVYYRDVAQYRNAQSYVAELERAHAFARPIVTEIQPLRSFRIAEDFHQDYAARHPDDPYIVVNDAPKLERLRRGFPHLYRTGQPPARLPPPDGMVRYRLGSVVVRMLADTTYGLQLLVEPTSSAGGSVGQGGSSVVWLRFHPDMALVWLNSASGVLRTPVSSGPSEAIQWSPNLRPLDGRGGFLLGRRRKKGVLQKDHWLAIADSAPGWQAKVSAQEADSLLRLFLVVAGQARIDSSSRAAADKEHVDRPAVLRSESRPMRAGSGRIAAQFVVGADGRVEPESILILLAASPRLEADAAELIAGWRFEPARRGEQAVRQLVQQVIFR